MKVKLLMLGVGLLACTGIAHADKAKAKALVADGVKKEKTGKWKKIKWIANFKQAVALARKTKKPILIFVAVPMNKNKRKGRC